MSVLAIIILAGTFYAVVFGLGLPWTCRSSDAPLEKLTKAAVSGIGQLYLCSWIIYTAGLPIYAYTLLPLAAAIGWGIRLRSISNLFAGSDAREVVVNLLLLAGWSLAWLATIHSYSGGEWAGDWLEHFQRSLFYLEHQPLDTKFYYHWTLTARPPLVNIVVADFMALFGKEFAVAQVVTTCFGVLILLPATLILDRFRNGTVYRCALLVLMMFNPLIVQNATFAWTKLPCTFFILAALVWFVPRSPEFRTDRWAAIAIAFAILAHYSAAPYAVALFVVAGLNWIWQPPYQGYRRHISIDVLFAAIILLTWFGWATFHFGLANTLFDNSTFQTDAGKSISYRLWLRIHAAWVTLVPHVLRPAEYSRIAQSIPLGYWRDYLFNIYQTTLPGAIGLGGLTILLAAPHRALAGNLGQTALRYWLWIAVAGFLLSVATVSWPDRWGIVHIGMSPLVLLALVWCAAALPDLRWKALWWASAALLCDAVLGIVLHFWIQATTRVDQGEMLRFLQEKEVAHSAGVMRNAILKLVFKTQFVADENTPSVLIYLLIAGIAMFAIGRLYTALRVPSVRESADRQ